MSGTAVVMFQAASRLLLAVGVLLVAPSALRAQAPVPAPAIVDGTYVLPSYRFRSGESLANVRLHYRTIGTPMRDARGKIRNAAPTTDAHRTQVKAAVWASHLGRFLSDLPPLPPLTPRAFVPAR